MTRVRLGRVTLPFEALQIRHLDRCHHCRATVIRRDLVSVPIQVLSLLALVRVHDGISLDGAVVTLGQCVYNILLGRQQLRRSSCLESATGASWISAWSCLVRLIRGLCGDKNSGRGSLCRRCLALNTFLVVFVTIPSQVADRMSEHQ